MEESKANRVEEPKDTVIVMHQVGISEELKDGPAKIEPVAKASTTTNASRPKKPMNLKALL